MVIKHNKYVTLSIFILLQYEIPAEGFDPPYFDYGLKVVRFYYENADKEDIFQKAHFLTKYYAGTIGVVLVNM